MQDSDIVIAKEGALGRITLNRPKALNALTHAMILAMTAALKAWAQDDAIAAVLIDAAPGRAFCAGGDIRALTMSGRARDGKAEQFFADEYRLNLAIHRFPKPYVALLHGLTMGGGAGISIHGRYRVACENTVFSMPETAIGLFPDIGASFFLNRMPGKTGLYAALAGARLSGAEMVYAGLATHHIPAAHFGDAVARLAAGEEAARMLSSLHREAGPCKLAGERAAIGRCFAAPTVEAIFAALGNEGAWGGQVRAMLEKCSPTSLKLTFALMQRTRGLPLESCLAMDYRLALRALEGNDFYEGVRAALIDKDQNPSWSPGALSAVTEADIAGYFATLGAREWKA